MRVSKMDFKKPVKKFFREFNKQRITTRLIIFDWWGDYKDMQTNANEICLFTRYILSCCKCCKQEDKKYFIDWEKVEKKYNIKYKGGKINE